MRQQPLGMLIPQQDYLRHVLQMNENIRDFKKLAPAAELEKYERFKRMPESHLMGNPDHPDFQMRKAAAAELIKAHSRALAKAGLTTSIGYNFFDLRGPSYLLFPVNTPFRNKLPRIGRVNDGYGTAAHWKANRNFGTVYGGVVEGQRNAIATPDEIDYTATYKELGVERAATFTSQFAGEGYTDNVADEHLRGLFELQLQEEGLMLVGNSGTAAGNNGFALGRGNTPVGTLLTSQGALTTTNWYTAYMVPITALGNPRNTQYGYGVFPTVAGGLTPSFTRTNADGSTTPVVGGTGQISLASNTVQVTSPNLGVSFVAAPTKGAFGYAWFIDQEASNTTVIGNAKLAAITIFPTFNCLANPTGTQVGSATGLSTDNSFNPYDFDGLLTYAITQGRFTDMAGGTFTKGVGGSVQEIDSDLQFLWDNFQAQPKAIWCSSDAKIYLDNTILASSNGGNNYRFVIEGGLNGQSNMMGGFVISSYKSKFTMEVGGGDSLPMRIHPMMPSGTIFYDIEDNPYPHSRIPFVRGMLVQRDYYSIEWPLVSRQWTFGTYVHEVLAHNIPWLSAARCGIGGAGT